VKHSARTAFGHLWPYVRPYRWALVAAVVLSSIVGLLEGVMPLLLGAVLDTVLGGAGTFTLDIPVLGNSLALSVPPGYGPWLLAGMILTILFKVAAGYGANTATAYLGLSVVRDLRCDVYRTIISQPLGFFTRNPTGRLMSRVSSDVGSIQTAVSSTLAELLKHSAVMISLIVVILLVDWRLSLISLFLLPLVFYPAVLFGRRIRRLARRNQEAVGSMAGILLETFTGSRIVKIFTMEQTELGRFREAVRRVFRVSLRMKLTDALSSPLMEVLGVLVLVGFLVYARNEIAAQRMTEGLFLTFVVALLKLYEPVRRLSGINNSFQQAIGASEKLFGIMATPGEADTGQRELKDFRHGIRFENVRFAYDSGDAVLDGVSFSVVRGEMLALVGPSGAGKTSLVNLIPRFHDVSEGRIAVDGVDLREFTLRSLREQIAMVTQDVILFNDTIRANIAYGNPSASDETILDAARSALVDDFVRTLPKGYDTVIGERGLRLSGGERQRISIARALLKDAPLLILDEATSSLDAESEALVQQALTNLIRGRTTIVIAHRLSTVRRADRILVLSDGRIQEEGMHEELILKRGLYWRLYQLQFEDVAP
jgi:ATP-binding cassette, subfamily B, bacterial MsbA